jgi:hypothetical protein
MDNTTLFDSYLPNRYIITIKENKNRHAHFKKELEEANINNAKIHFSKKYLFKSIFKNTAQRSMTLAHMHIQKLTKFKHNSNVVILEDDICFVDDFKQKMEPVLKDLKNQDWDIFYFFKPVKGNRSDYDAKRGDIVEEFDSGLVKTIGTINTHALAINFKNIDKILTTYSLDFIKSLPLQIRTIDKSLSNSGLNMYACSEDLIYQSDKFPSCTMHANPNASLWENIKLYFKQVGDGQ